MIGIVINQKGTSETWQQAAFSLFRSCFTFHDFNSGWDGIYKTSYDILKVVIVPLLQQADLKKS